jgi:integrase
VIHRGKSRGKATWLVRVFLGRNEDGKRLYVNRTVHGTKKDAEAVLHDLLAKKGRGALSATSRERLGDFLDRWLRDVATHRVHARTLAVYEDCLARYIRPELGGIRLCDLKPARIQAVYSELLERGLSARTIQLAHAPLRSALQIAVKQKVLEYNPARAVELPTVQRSKASHALDEAQHERFIKAAEAHEFGAPFMFAVATGMRPGEYAGLRWSDIDTDAAVARVERALARIRGEAGWRLKAPKTESGTRVVPLSDVALRALRKQRAWQAKAKLAAGRYWQEHDLVFTTELGTPIDVTNWTWRYLKRHPSKPGKVPAIFEVAGIPNTVRLYDLRHTFGTHAARVTDPRTVADLMGHSKVQVTLDTYVHPNLDRKREAIAKLEGALSAKG